MQLSIWSAPQHIHAFAMPGSFFDIWLQNSRFDEQNLIDLSTCLLMTFLLSHINYISI